MSLIHTAIFFPYIELSMTAQTKENAASIFEEKYREIIRYYPDLKSEIVTTKFSKDIAEVTFTSGGMIDILANQQSSKGRRRRRLNIEESALLNAALFDDVLAPVVEVGRRTAGGSLDPQEMNSQINFFTTAGFRGSDEYVRNVQMVKQMSELGGVMVLGASWELANAYGRGRTKAQIMATKDTTSPVFFGQNYLSHWQGASDGALVNISKVMELRTLTQAELKSDGKSKYIISVDVARSTSRANNQSSIAIFKLKHSTKGRLVNAALCNLINLPNGLSFGAQAEIIKNIAKVYQAEVVVVDGAGLGIGLVDELLKETIDTNTGETLGCWDTINTDHEPETSDAEKKLYVITSQGIQHDIIVNFMNFVESGKLRLLAKKTNASLDPDNIEYYTEEMMPYIQTDFLFEEISNLKVEQNANRKLSLKQLTTRVDKDRVMAVMYGLYYIKQYEDNLISDNQDINANDFIFISPPSTQKQQRYW